MMVNKLLKNLISLKKQQVEAFELQDWTQVSKLEADFQFQSKDFHIEPDDITQEVVEDLHEINALNNQLLSDASQIKEKSLKQLLEIKKGKLAVKAYSSK